MNTRVRWSRRLLALGHLGCGFAFLLGNALFVAFVLGVRPSGTAGFWMGVLNLGFSSLGPFVAFLPQAALGLWLLVLARWLWAGQRRLRLALLVTHGFLLLLGSLYIHIGFRAVAAAERSTERGGGLLSPIAALPLLQGVTLSAFALCSILLALAVTGNERRRLP